VSDDECYAIATASLDEDGLQDLATVHRLPDGEPAELLVDHIALGPPPEAGNSVVIVPGP